MMKEEKIKEDTVELEEYKIALKECEEELYKCNVKLEEKTEQLRELRKYNDMDIARILQQDEIINNLNEIIGIYKRLFNTCIKNVDKSMVMLHKLQRKT